MDPGEITHKKYLSIETYRKNNKPVQSPVWFVIYNDLIYVVTRTQTGKIKRLKNTKNVRVALCNFKGKILGDWHPGVVTFCSPEETKIVLDLRRKKYGFIERIARFASRKKGDLIVFSIKLE